MNISSFIARRYLISKKTQNVINIISFISLLGIATGTFALVIVLSVYNGFEGLIHNMFGAFDPDIKITAVQGKWVDITPDKLQLFSEKFEGFEAVGVLEENVLLKYGDKMQPAIMKGVTDNYIKVSRFDTLIREGTFKLDTSYPATAVCGQGLAYYLGMGVHFITPVAVYAAKPGLKAETPENAFSTGYFFPSGFFSVQPDIDVKYFLIAYRHAAEITGNRNKYSAVEIYSKNQRVDIEKLKPDFKAFFGNNFEFKTKHQQHELLYKIMKSEKLVIYAILSFILLIASFNVIGSITMLMIEKKHDIAVMQSFGLNKSKTRQIFLFEGTMITMAGAFAGILTGIFACWLQIKYHFIKLGDAAYFVIDYYPVEVRITDIILVIIIVMAIGLFASWYPVRVLTRRYFSVKNYH